MKLKVELTWWNGVLAGDGSDEYPDPDYEIVDADTGRPLADRNLQTYEEVEAFIAASYPGCERWAGSAHSPEKAAGLEKVLAMLEAQPDVVVRDAKQIRTMLIGQFYEYGHAGPVLARIRTALGRIGPQVKARHP